MEQFKLKKDEKLVARVFYTGDEDYPCMIQVEIICTIETKYIYDADEYAPFIKIYKKLNTALIITVNGIIIGLTM